MNKFLKILFAVELILILAIIALALAGKQKITAYAVKENASAEKTDFRILTKAVCEKKYERMLCHDELFMECNGREYLIVGNDSNGFIECSNIKLSLSSIVNSSNKLKRD